MTVLMNAQASSRPEEPMRVGPGVTPPRLIHKVEPQYSSEARSNNIQGTVIFELVVSGKGRAVDITVISPLGFGLDEKAQAAIEQWEFVPGMKDGVPVSILAHVEVTFRFLNSGFDEKAEQRRGRFNVVQQALGSARSTPGTIENAVKSILDLSKQKFPPAMHQAGVWKCAGEHVPKDCTEGLELIQKSAAKHYGPAVYEIGIRRIEGRDLPQDVEKGLQEIREAATLGSRQAQFYLGTRYETGNGVPLELDRARRYYRLCAAQGAALCQYRLGRLLYYANDRRERDLMQALALFQLAAEQGLPEAKQVIAQDTTRLTAEQTSWISSLKRQIVRK